MILKGRFLVKRFKNKVVLITGAIGGLGNEELRVFAEEGADIAINHLNTPEFITKAEKLIEDLTVQYGGTYRHYAADVTNEDAVNSMMNQITEEFGRIDILVNNAGIMRPSITWKTPLELWQRTIDINLTGAFLCTKAAVPYMRKQKYGRIIFLSSVGGLSGIKANASYCASKAGVIGLMKPLVKEVADSGITVNCVAPGFIAAGMMDGVDNSVIDKELLPFIPMAKMGQAADVAKAIAFLASDDASYITGEVLRVDGGFSM